MIEQDPIPSSPGVQIPPPVNPEPTAWSRWIPWLACLPFNLLVAWPFVLVCGRRYRWRSTGWLTGTWRPAVQKGLDWLASKVNPADPNRRRGWHYSTTLGHGTCFDPTHLTSPDGLVPETIGHEREHTQQGEDLACIAFVLAVVIMLVEGWSSWPLALGVWVSSYGWLLIGFVVAVLRGWRVYRDAWHERMAYALSNRRGGFSWREQFAKDRKSRE